MGRTADSLLVFALVSTAALASAWILGARLRSLPVREAIWKCAVLLSLTLPLAYTGGSLVGGRVVTESVSVRIRDPRVLDELGVPRLEGRAPEPGAVRISPLAWRVASVLPRVLLLLGALNALRLLIAWGRELRSIGPRRPVALGPSLREQLEASRARKVRLTTAAGMSVPGVVGSREICIPEVDAARTESPALVAVVAHEAAHVERLDLFWLRLLGVAGAFFFFQPLFRVARRELIRIFEFQADELAVQRTGHRAALVDALLVYAERTGGAVREGTLAFATGESQLVKRARRILTVDVSRRPRALYRWLPVAAVLVGTAGAVAPPVGEPHVRRARAEVLAIRGRPAAAALVRPGRPNAVRTLPSGGPNAARALPSQSGDAPLLHAVQTVQGRKREATIRRDPAGDLVTEFRIEGRTVAATPELEGWLRGVLSPDR